jgi:hypothetical protein
MGGGVGEGEQGRTTGSISRRVGDAGDGPNTKKRRKTSHNKATRSKKLP